MFHQHWPSSGWVQKRADTMPSWAIKMKLKLENISNNNCATREKGINLNRTGQKQKLFPGLTWNKMCNFHLSSSVIKKNIWNNILYFKNRVNIWCFCLSAQDICLWIVNTYQMDCRDLGWILNVLLLKLEGLQTDGKEICSRYLLA